MDNLNLIKKAISNIDTPYIFDKEDLIDTGILAFIEAINRYDVKSHNIFSTYAYKTVKLYVLSYINERANVIKIDNNIKYKIGKLNSNKQNNISERNALKYKKYGYMYNVISFNEKIKTILNEEEEIGNIIKTEYDLEKTVEINEAYNIFLNCLNELPARNSNMIKQYLGIGYDIKNTVELGKQYHITYQRVNEIIKRVIRDISNSEDGQKIKQLLK